MKNLSHEFVDLLLNAKNYRSFLALFFDKELSQKCKDKTPLSYAEFSRRAGFSSRAFIRDVISGDKRVCLSNFDKICLGLKLNSDLKEYFKAMVSAEEADFQAHIKTEPKIVLRRQSEKIRKSLAIKRINLEDPEHQVRHQMRKVLSQPGVSLVFAASGTEAGGASFQEIQKRCRLDEKTIEKAIKELVRFELLSSTDGRFYPCSAHIAIERLGGDEFFKIDFERSITMLKKNFETRPQHAVSLFLSSTFCVEADRLPKLKEHLNKALLEFINEAEASEGDTIVNLIVGLTPN